MSTTTTEAKTAEQLATQRTLQWESRFIAPPIGGANHQNFWWAHRHADASRELVNQFHTENGAASAPRAAGGSEIGWRCTYRAVGGLTRLAADFDLRSVSEIEDPQATVEQHLRLVVSIARPGQPEQVIDLAEQVLRRGGTGAGRLEIETELALGQVYQVTASSRIAIRYQNRDKIGYGETIVRFPALTVGRTFGEG